MSQLPENERADNQGNLQRYPRAWVSRPPELALGSGRLEFPAWSTDVFDDPDPELDDLPPFDELWRAPPPPPPPLPRPRPLPPAPPVLPAHSRILSRLSSPSSPAERSSSLPAATQRAVPDHSARREWWRATIANDARFGLIDSVLKAEYATPFVPSAPRTEDEWKLPKRLDQQRHPFHPALHTYLRRSGARVYWVIPVHGPVIIPGWGDPIAGSRTPFTSRGEMDETLPQARGEDKARPLLWTPAILGRFVAALVQLQHEGRYGRLRLAPSGPKPDPFLPGNRGSVPSSHSYVPKRKKRPKSSSDATQEELFTPENVPPAGVECGDHLRVYVDAHKALSFRTWLNYWDEGRFAKCRYALVAPTGECLIVA